MDLKLKGYNVICWGGHPSTILDHDNNLVNPVYGDCLTRNKISILWNNYLEQKCIKNNIYFINILNYLINNDDELTNMDFFIDYCHLKSSFTFNIQ